jgi:hypothetical protein
MLIAFGSKDHGADVEHDLAPTLRAGGHSGSHANAGVPPAIAYGIRSDASRTGEAKTPSADAEGRVRLRNPGMGVYAELAPTVDASQPHAVAFALRGREGGAMPEAGGDQVGSLRAASGGSSRDYVAFGIGSDAVDRSGEGASGSAAHRAGLNITEGFQPALRARPNNSVAIAATAETMYGVSHADASQTGPDQALRALREAVGPEAYSEWGLGVVAALWPAEVLRPEVHGGGVRCATDQRDELGHDAPSRAERGSAGPVQHLWQVGCIGRPPQGWQPPERLAVELGAHLSELSHQGTSPARFLLGLWRSSEGLGLLREALSALQAAWRPEHRQGQSAPLTSAVRRLTPRECERLMGFPDDYTLIPWRKGMAPDGLRYKALGNSMAVPVMAWIGRRIAQVEALSEQAAA